VKRQVLAGASAAAPRLAPAEPAVRPVDRLDDHVHRVGAARVRSGGGQTELDGIGILRSRRAHGQAERAGQDSESSDHHRPDCSAHPARSRHASTSYRTLRDAAPSNRRRRRDVGAQVGYDPPRRRLSPGPDEWMIDFARASKDAHPRNVLGTRLESCCTDPMTGFYRTGSCDTGPEDLGRHVVCAVMTERFLAFSVADGNDLSTPRPEWGFPGLKPGDRWCVCASRWADAEAAGEAPPVVLEATHSAALEVIPLETLKAHSVVDD
jgi:uncharacterized protein (DUF2237 family)